MPCKKWLHCVARSTLIVVAPEQMRSFMNISEMSPLSKDAVTTAEGLKEFVSSELQSWTDLQYFQPDKFQKKYNLGSTITVCCHCSPEPMS